MKIESKVSRQFALFAIDKFIKPENIDKTNFSFFARETKMIGQLYSKYPNEEFWKKMNLGFLLNSFAYFKTLQGNEELEKQWRLFQFSKELDKKSNSPIFKEDRLIETPIISGKNLNVFEWISS
jgi:hypothetical protein